jgi:hypothetical protein
MSANVPKGLITEDGYGSMTINKFAADYFWGDKPKPHKAHWKPKAKIPQLETLIDVFKGTDILIAGGAVLGSLDAVEYTDIDVFPLTLKAVSKAEKLLVGLGYKKTSQEDHFLMYERTVSSARPVQIILMHTDVDGDPQKVLNRFDLSVCQVGVFNGQLVSNDIAMEDIHEKVLRALTTMNVNSLFKRVMKYNGRGYGVIDGLTEEEKKEEDKRLHEKYSSSS